MSWENLATARDDAWEKTRAEPVVGVCRRDAWFWLPGVGQKYCHGGRETKQRKTEQANKRVALVTLTREGLLNKLGKADF